MLLAHQQFKLNDKTRTRRLLAIFDCTNLELGLQQLQVRKDVGLIGGPFSLSEQADYSFLDLGKEVDISNVPRAKQMLLWPASRQLHVCCPCVADLRPRHTKMFQPCQAGVSGLRPISKVSTLPERMLCSLAPESLGERGTL